METVKIKDIEVSRFIIGGNPFGGFAHHSPEMDWRMRRYYTTARIKETLREAERLGVNTLIARSDMHVARLLFEYWNEGGKVQWVAQTCPGVGSPELAVDRAADYGALACYVHGGYVDFLVAQGRSEELQPIVDRIREAGMVAGIAGHNPKVFRWAEDNLSVDFYMCSYYNASPRDERPNLVPGVIEKYVQEDRQAMTDMIQRLSRPVIHYKILAAGRNDPAEAFLWAARSMRPNDAVCVGVYTEDDPDMLAEDVRIFEQSLQEASR